MRVFNRLFLLGLGVALAAGGVLVVVEAIWAWTGSGFVGARSASGSPLSRPHRGRPPSWSPSALPWPPSASSCFSPSFAPSANATRNLRPAAGTGYCCADRPRATYNAAWPPRSPPMQSRYGWCHGRRAGGSRSRPGRHRRANRLCRVRPEMSSGGCMPPVRRPSKSARRAPGGCHE